MRFFDLVTLAVALLQREGRVTYRGLQREFGLDDDLLEDLRAELILAKGVATDEGGRVLVWTGGTPGSLSRRETPSSDLDLASLPGNAVTPLPLIAARIRPEGEVAVSPASGSRDPGPDGRVPAEVAVTSATVVSGRSA